MLNRTLNRIEMKYNNCNCCKKVMFLMCESLCNIYAVNNYHIYLAAKSSELLHDVYFVNCVTFFVL